MDPDNAIADITPIAQATMRDTTADDPETKESAPIDEVVVDEEVIEEQPWHPIVWAGLGLIVGLFWSK